MVKFRWNYKDAKSFEERIEEAQLIKRLYPNSVPVIVQKHPRSNMVDIPRKKYIIPRDKTFSHLYYLLRKQAKLRPEQSFFLLLNNFTPSMMSPIDDLYKNHADADEFIYICYFEENTFGNCT